MYLFNFIHHKKKKSFRVLLTVTAFCFSLGVFAQQQSVSIRGAGLTLKNVFQQIEAQTNLSVDYDTNQLDALKEVATPVRGRTVKAVMDEVLAGSGFVVVYNKSHVVVRKGRQGVRKNISGMVVDEMGEPVVGANVVLKGGDRIGTVTNADGKFILEVPDNAVLVVSYIGYTTEEFPVGGQSVLNIQLSEDTQNLEEVVVVGYGVQKKVNLTGSVASVNVSEMAESRPIVNVSNALAGAAAGLNVTAASNRPGEDGANLMIRGVGTFSSAGSAPLVIIDGVEGYLNDINVHDVENISILKDAASAAIYGSRAANGVILVTTKSGKAGKMKLSYNGYVTFQSAKTDALEPVSNFADYMEYMNEGYRNSGVESLPYQQSTITAWRNDNGKNPLIYPNTNWLEEVFRTGVGTNHTVSMQGGSEAVQFYGSLGFYNNPGVVENAGYKRYHAMSNITANITYWLKMGINFNGYYGTAETAGYRNENGLFDLGYSYHTTPAQVFEYDGRYGGPQTSDVSIETAGNNPVRGLHASRGDNITRNGKGKFFITVNPIKDLDVTGSMVYEYTCKNTKSLPVFHDVWNFATNTIIIPASGTSYIGQEAYRNQRNYMDLVAHYNRRLVDERLGFAVMAGASQEQYISENEGFTRQDLIDLSVGVVSAANGDITRLAGEKSVWSMRSYFGRINLDWENKYLLEFDMRYDGSSRFLKGNRWGLFPSFSAGWRISEEDFLQEGIFNNLKLRASYGSLGNNSVGNYAAHSTYSNRTYIVDGQVQTGWAITSLANPLLTWEKTRVTDVGLDFGILGNQLTGTFDWFHKKTTGILLWLTIPNVNGDLTGVTSNNSEVSNKGIELSLSWNDKIGDFRYGISANYTHVKNTIDKHKGLRYMTDWDINGTSLIREGGSLGDLYMYEVDRIIQTDADLQYVQDLVAKNPDYFKSVGGRVPEKGDVLFKDWAGVKEEKNADGSTIQYLMETPDGKLTPDDRKVVGNTNPTDFLGINLSAGWRGVDLSVRMDGAFGHKGYLSTGFFTNRMDKDHQISKYVVENAWREGVSNAIYPMLSYNTLVANDNSNTIWLKSRNFMKIRNIQLGYTLPKDVTRKFAVERLRFYGSLENFFTFTGWKGIDPETANLTYPTMRQAVIGLNVEF